MGSWVLGMPEGSDSRHRGAGLTSPPAPLAKLRAWWRTGWSGPALLCATVLAFFAPVVFGGRAFFLKDAQLVIYPTRLVLRDRLLAGDLPEWLPSLDLGMPFLANPSNGVLYPLNLLLLLPAPWCVGVFIVAHFFVAALGSWALCRALGVSREAAMVGSLGFALGGYLVSLTWGTMYMLSLAWLPLVAFLAWRSFSKRSVASAAVAGVALGFQILSGEPQGTWMTLWLVLTLAIARPGTWRSRLVSLGLLGAMTAIGVCLAMPQLLPTAELLPRSRRAGGIDLEQAQHWSLHPLRLLELLVPWLYGNPLRFGEFLGYFMNDEGGTIHRDPWMVTPTFGGLGFLFALVGGTEPRWCHRWWVRAVAILSIVTLLVAFGRHTPAFTVYFSSVPLAGIFRYPAKYFGLLAATLPLLAAAGVDSLRHRRAGSTAFLVAVLAAVGLIGVALGLARPLAGALQAQRPEVSEALAHGTVLRALITELVLLASLGGALLWLRLRRARWVAMAAAGAVAVELAWQLPRAYETAPNSIYSQTPPLARAILERTPPGEVPRVLHALPFVEVAGFDDLPGPERAALLAAHLPRNVGIAFGVHYARSYISSEEGPKWNLWQTTDHRRLVDVFGTRAIVLSGLAAPPVDDSLEPLAGVGTPTGAAYWNLRALPYARAVPSPMLVTSQEEAVASLAAPAIVRGVTTALEVEHPTRESTAGSEASCRLLSRPTDTIRFACEVKRAGWVVVNESHHPNFRATLDGDPVPIVRANGFVLAVWLPKGRHDLALTYSEPSLIPGFAVSMLGLLLACGLWLRERPRSA